MAKEYFGRKECRRSMQLPSTLAILRNRAAKAFGAAEHSVELWLDAGAQGRVGRGRIKIENEDQYKQIKEDDVIVVVLEGVQIDPTELAKVYVSATHQDFVRQDTAIEDKTRPIAGVRTHIPSATGFKPKFKGKTAYRDEYGPIFLRARPASVCATARPSSVCSSRPAPQAMQPVLPADSPVPWLHKARDKVKDADWTRKYCTTTARESYKKPQELTYKSISEIEHVVQAKMQKRPIDALDKVKPRQTRPWDLEYTEYTSEYNTQFPRHSPGPPAGRRNKQETPKSLSGIMPGSVKGWEPPAPKKTNAPRKTFCPPTPPERGIAPPALHPEPFGDRQTGQTLYQNEFVKHPPTDDEKMVTIGHAPEAWALPRHRSPFIHLEPYVGTDVIA